MTKFYGVIGYGETVETPPGSGIHKMIITERPYSGDIYRVSRTLEGGEKVNDDLSIGNSFSIIADSYLNDNLQSMRYIMWRGTRWKISKIDEVRPRLILTPGGVYNGETP